jgi:hypothetical protein
MVKAKTEIQFSRSELSLARDVVQVANDVLSRNDQIRICMEDTLSPQDVKNLKRKMVKQSSKKTRQYKLMVTAKELSALVNSTQLTIEMFRQSKHMNGFSERTEEISGKVDALMVKILNAAESLQQKP